MPESSRTRRKPVPIRKPIPVQVRMDNMIENARKLDARRQAQIKHQIEAINRLLKDGTYSVEMETLHMAAATLAAENDELKQGIREFLDAFMAQQLEPSEVTGQTYSDALSSLRTLVNGEAG